MQCFAGFGRSAADRHSLHWGILSDWRLCGEMHLNLACLWFCRLGMEGGVPDYSTCSKDGRGRLGDGDLLRMLFDKAVARCSLGSGGDVEQPPRL